MTFSEWKTMIDIVEKFHPGERLFAGVEHDIAYINLTEDNVSEDSEDGKKLVAFGFFVEDDGWARYV